jgi:hypothetical protein
MAAAALAETRKRDHRLGYRDAGPGRESPDSECEVPKRCGCAQGARRTQGLFSESSKTTATASDLGTLYNITTHASHATAVITIAERFKERTDGFVYVTMYFTVCVEIWIRRRPRRAIFSVYVHSCVHMEAAVVDRLSCAARKSCKQDGRVISRLSGSVHCLISHA